MAPDVSTATGWKIKRQPNIVNSAIFMTLAVSATDPAGRVRFKVAKVLTYVASQMRQRSRE